MIGFPGPHDEGVSMTRLPEILRKPARALRDVHRRVVLARAVAAARRDLATGAPSPATLAALHRGWGNAAWSADPVYLGRLLDLAGDARRPVLECGSGISTLLLALLAERTGTTIVSLEHSPPWKRRVEEALDRFGLGERARVLACPLRPAGDYAWYDLSGHDLPDGLDLVVCDGPPGDTPGGRYGMWPELRERIDGGTRILVDDAHRPEEREALARWEREFGAETTYEAGGRIAVVTAGAAARTPSASPTTDQK
jgi:hypothetical protein